MTKKSLIAFLTLLSISSHASSLSDGVNKIISAFPSEDPAQAARLKFEKGEYVFIFYSGFSVSAPGDFPLGMDIILRNFESVTLPTSDTPIDAEEVRVFKKAHTFSKKYNEEMFRQLLAVDKIRIFEVLYEVESDAVINISYIQGPVRLREKKGRVRKVWIEEPDSFKVASGNVTIIESKPVTLAHFMKPRHRRLR